MNRYFHIISKLRADYGGKGPLLDEAADAIEEAETRAEKYRNTLAEYLESHSKQAELINRLEAELVAERERAGSWLNATADLRLENERLRAALANSELPCVYCTLPKEKWNECKNGFPGCDRADDAMGCPELGARMEADELRWRVAKLREALGRLFAHIDTVAYRDSAGLRLGPTVPHYESARAALAETGGGDE